MTEQEARELLVRAGLELAGTGLIVRTWGNISCRLNDESFVITPSGRSYDAITAGDMVVCKISNASHTGNIKPSVEKGMHALIYRERSDVGFVIHTHQKWASAVAASDIREMNSVPVAEYAFAGSKALTQAVAAVLPEVGNALLLSHHGALCFGGDSETAFDAARALEENCQRFILMKYIKDSGDKKPQDLRNIFDYCAGLGERESLPEIRPLRAESRRDGEGFIFSLDGAETRYTKLNAYMPEEAKLHEDVYRARPDISFIESSGDDAVISCSLKGAPLLPMLDDFAQVVGFSVKCAADNGIAGALKGNSRGLIIAGRGALCFAATKLDAHTAKLVVEKNAAAMLTSKLFGETKPIGFWKCLLMHQNYIHNYSKKA